VKIIPGNRIGRFLLASVVATYVSIAIFLIDLLFVDDRPGHVYAIWERLLNGSVIVSSWPLTLSSIFLQADPPGALWIPLWFLGGFSWGIIFEFCIYRIVLRNKFRPHS